MTVLIAQLATSGGVRAPLAHLANQVFVELANELAAQGVSRKVSADMFGMALRAYIRKVRRLSEGSTEPGRTLWQAVLDFIRGDTLVARSRVLSRFARDGEIEVSSVLHDLTESGLVFCSGSGRNAVYRAATDDELGQFSRLGGESGLDEMAWVLIYRHGATRLPELAAFLRCDEAQAQTVVARLLDAGRVQDTAQGYVAKDFVVALGSSVGWEAAVFDHFQAVVQTICQRLRTGSAEDPDAKAIGGSTYSFDLWPGHPLEQEVKAQLSAIRTQCSALRQRVEAINAASPRGTAQQVVFYAGQCVLDSEAEGSRQENGDDDA
ncbi:MAG TPA: hypothetical protein VFZ61_32320 [Polyangiales bacterium]